MIGHVHLQVGDTAKADAFYAGLCGLDVAARYPGASFYGSGGYHHQLAANVWNSRDAGPRPAGAAGLAAVELVARDADVRAAFVARAGGPHLQDPWGTRIELRG
jgi:catechol 2,3-dioxygenase